MRLVVEPWTCCRKLIAPVGLGTLSTKLGTATLCLQADLDAAGVSQETRDRVLQALASDPILEQAKVLHNRGYVAHRSSAVLLFASGVLQLNYCLMHSLTFTWVPPG